MIDVDDTDTSTANSNLNNHPPEHFRRRLSELIHVPSTGSATHPSTTFTATGLPLQPPEDATIPQHTRPMSQPSMAVESRAHSYHDRGPRHPFDHQYSNQHQQSRQPPGNHDGEQDILRAPQARTTIDLSTILPPPPPQQSDYFRPHSGGPPTSTIAPMSDSDKTTPRKRVASLSVEEASRHPQIQDLSLYTPVTTQSMSYLNGGIGGPGPVAGEPKDLICLCTKAPKVPRPRNAFILYRQHYQAQVAAQHPGLANPEISKLIGEQWREQPEEIKNSWKRLAEEEKVRHQRQYPDYRYQPRRGGKNAAANKLGIGAGSASGEDPGRCQKCGGRFIATPRTPTTLFSAATQGFAKTPAAAMPTYMASKPNSRAMEADRLRRGSTSSMMSVDSHGRRYTQPFLRDVDEDYPMMSPTGPPAPKRQRFHGPNGYMPTSPQSGTYMARPEDPRLYPNGFMPSNTPMSASGFGTGSLPRLSMSQAHQQQQEQQTAYHQPNSISGMQPPPRPSVSYQGAAQSPVTRAGSGFDESLRLPPLQTRLTKSPPMNSVAGTTTQNALGIVNPAGPPVQQRQNPAPQRLQFLYKLEVLRAISPPLKAPGPDAPAFETRGPIIAIEGLSPRTLKDITAVVEKALSISGECAVKVWADHEPVKEIVGSEKSVSDRKTPEDGKAKDEGNRPASSIAKYLARMLKWHHTSEELVKYVTHHPPSPDFPLHSPSSGDRSTATAEAMEVERAAPEPGTGSMGSSPRLNKQQQQQVPVAVVSTGYSLTATEAYASALPIADAYRAEDHWRWVATLWRGVVGADLTVYVRACGDDELRAATCVDFANPAVLVIRVPEGGGASGGGTGIVDEKLERRLGFEIMEWVRSGQFGRRLGWIDE